MRNETLYTLLALAVLALTGGPIGAAVVLGFFHGESPCVLCWAQRTGMILIALVGLFILRYGPRPRYIGLGVLVGAYGLYMAARHSALHVWRDIGQGFAVELLGAHTYIWSAFIFWVAVVLMGLLLIAMQDGAARGERRALGPLGTAAAVLFLVAVAGNALQAFVSTGPPPYMGQSDPVRLSPHPRHWVWSLEEWQPVPLGWRGRYAVEKPGVARLEPDAGKGPLAGLPALASTGERRLPALNGPLADLSYESQTGRFVAVTSKAGVYVLDGSLGRVERHTVVDPTFAVDLGTIAGAAWLDARTLAVLGDNKSYVLLRENDRADADANFRYFLEGADRFDEIGRGRFGTVRARMQYVMALAFDSARDSFYTVTVPNRRHKRLVVSRFLREDMTLAEEFRPALAAGSGLALAGEGRSLDEYYVTGLAARDARLWALSAAHGTLLVIDPAAHAVTGAWRLEGVGAPVGLAVGDAELFVAGADGRVVVFPRP
jgi:disulfide bond formation protein DsbB